MAWRLETTINRPAEEVFAVLTDAEQTGKWFPVKVEEQWTSPPPHGVGSTRHAVVHAFGRTSENDATITEYDPPRRGAIVVDSPGVKVEVALDFAPVESGTRVFVTFDTEGPSLMRIVMAPVLGWYVSKWRQGLATVKAMMESGQL